MRRLFATLTMTLLAASAQAQTPVLTIYAPDSFASEWGPGPQIEKGFEAQCACDVQFSAGELLPRLLLETDTGADVAIGFTSDQTKKARETGLFAPHGQSLAGLTMPVAWQDEVFLPFNWGHTAFVYDSTRLTDVPDSLMALANAPDDLKIAIQDPRSSISGLALVLWVKVALGDQAEEFWTKLAPKVVASTKGWSESYGMFTNGEVDLVLSYTTSPAYHLLAEKDATKKAAIFSEGHYFMVETAARLADSDQPELAGQFMAYVLSEEFQKMIPAANYAFPAKLEASLLPAEFGQLAMPDKVLFLNETEAAAMRDGAIAEWLNAFGG